MTMENEKKRTFVTVNEDFIETLSPKKKQLPGANLVPDDGTRVNTETDGNNERHGFFRAITPRHNIFIFDLYIRSVHTI